MSLLNNLQIGLTSSSLTPLPYARKQEVGVDEEYIQEVKEATDNSVNVTYTGRRRRSWQFTFYAKSKADFDALSAYCNVPQKYWVRHQNQSGLIEIDGFCYLQRGGYEIIEDSDDFRYTCTVTITET